MRAARAERQGWSPAQSPRTEGKNANPFYFSGW